MECFLCHTREAQHSSSIFESRKHQRVLALRNSLSRRGVSSWLDGNTVRGNILESTVAAIESSQCVVISLSNSLIGKVDSCRFSICQFEVNMAMRLKSETLVLVMIEPLIALRSDSILGRFYSEHCVLPVLHMSICNSHDA